MRFGRWTSHLDRLLPRAVVVLVIGLWVYFGHAAVQGNFGMLRRVEVNDSIRELEMQLAELDAQVQKMENNTRRLSVDYLDLDLLDERARKVLGYIRSDEIVIN